MEEIGVLGDDNSTACARGQPCLLSACCCEHCAVTIECNSYLCLQ